MEKNDRRFVNSNKFSDEKNHESENQGRSPKARVKVKDAGSTTNLSHTSGVFRPKAEKGRETIKMPAPNTVATIPVGLTNKISAIIFSADISCVVIMSWAKAAVPNGMKTITEITKKTIDCFNVLCIHISFLSKNRPKRKSFLVNVILKL